MSEYFLAWGSLLGSNSLWVMPMLRAIQRRGLTPSLHHPKRAPAVWTAVDRNKWLSFPGKKEWIKLLSLFWWWWLLFYYLLLFIKPLNQLYPHLHLNSAYPNAFFSQTDSFHLMVNSALKSAVSNFPSRAYVQN